MAEIQNPNQQGGGGQDSRSLFGFMIVFVLMVVAFQVFGPKKPQAPAHPAPRAAAAQPAPSATDEPASASQAARGATSTPAANAIQSASESETVVENELYRITFTNRGAQVKSWILKKYTDEHGKPLDLVNQQAAKKFGLPLSLFTYDAGLRSRLNAALYVPSATGSVAAPASLSFQYSAGGLTVHKTFRFDSTYVIHADVTVTENGAPVTAMLEWAPGLGDEVTAQNYAASFFNQSIGGKTDQLAAKKVSGGNTLHGDFDYAGISDLYFAAVVMPDTPSDTQVVTLHDTISIPKNPEHPDAGDMTKASVLGLAVGQAGDGLHARMYVGPKSLDVLESVHAANGASLEPLVSFGWVGWIAKPMFLVLRFFVQHGISNWGWSILILTLILNLAMLPTRFMMMKSSLKMQRIQPQIEAVKAKYSKYKATDPRRQEMNQEIFDLQRREGVNMFGGCLPMLLQYPLLWGFYRMLENVIELRHAHWLWLPDLSAADPMHILPIFVIVSMFLSQFFTPSPGMDQSQQRMMAFMMPVVFGFMMWNIGSGVALYWAGSNLMGVAQQMVMNRTSMGREMRAIAAKRAAKKAGKTIQGKRRVGSEG